jgi:hypothetical protein
MIHERWGATEEARSHKRLGDAIAGRPSPWPRRLLGMLCVAAALAILLSGCAWADPYSWESTPRHRPLKPLYVVVSRDLVTATCPPMRGWISHACAVRSPADGLCIILVTEPDPPEWIREHEEKHCRGYDHA